MSATILISNLGVDDDDYHDDLVFSSLSKVFKSYPDNGEMIYAIKYQPYCHELKRVTDGFPTKIKANIKYDAQCMKRDLMYFWRKLHTQADQALHGLHCPPTDSMYSVYMLTTRECPDHPAWIWALAVGLLCLLMALGSFMHVAQGYCQPKITMGP